MASSFVIPPLSSSSSPAEGAVFPVGFASGFLAAAGLLLLNAGGFLTGGLG
jgi:hypothetical protein